MVNRRVGNLRKEHGSKKGGFFSHYRPPPADHVKRQAERKGGKFDSIFKGNFDVFTPKEGDNTLRMLPPGWDGAGDYAYPAWIHWSIGADESSYLCLRKMKGETCPICQEVARMKADGEGDDAKRIDCKERFICWVIDRSDRDETPALYSMPAGTYKDINALCYSGKTGKAIFIDNPDDGYDVIIRRTGTKINTKYLPQVDREASAITDDPDKYKELEQWVQDNQIPDVLQYFDADYLERALSGEIDRNRGEGTEEDDEDRPRRRPNRKEDPPPGDDDDEPPRRRHTRTRRDEDEDEEERPTRRGGKARDADIDDELDNELPFDDDAEEEAENESENEAREARQDRQARSRGRGRADDDDELEDRPRRNKPHSSRDEDEDEPEERRTRRRPRDEDEDPGEEDDSPPRTRTRPRDRDERRSGNRRV